jgi:ribosomal protein S18 acetylase RimI-like enzyme
VKPGISVYRALGEQLDQAFSIVQEYYAAACVVVREERGEFQEQYFGDGAGVWLAAEQGRVVGCIALRKLHGHPGCGEIKRLYVQPVHRGHGIAEQLLSALESYAKEFNYRYLFLDTTDEMIAAQRFYERCGYQRCTRYNDNPQATIFMRKAL